MDYSLFIIFVLVIVIAINYSYLTFLVLSNQNSRNKSPKPKPIVDYSFTIVVPFRNESQNLPTLLDSIKQLDYPQHLIQILLVDDQSTDDSLSKINPFLDAHTQVIPNSGTGKKDALKTAFRWIHTDAVVLTDADCIVPKNWLNSYQDSFRNPTTLLCLGPITFVKKSGLLYHLQQLENLSLMAITKAFTQIEKPILANGANLGFKALILEKSPSLNPESPSGDDIFLLNFVEKMYGRKAIAYLSDRDALVKTYAQTTLSEFWNQRLRWASKQKHVKNSSFRWLGYLVFLINFSIVLLLIVGFSNPYFWVLCLALWTYKTILDSTIVAQAARHTGINQSLGYLPILAVIYPFYISFAAIFSQFFSFNWKDRTYRA